MNLSVATKIFLGFVAVIVTFGVVSIISVLKMRQNANEIRLVSECYLPLTKIAAQIDGLHQNRQRDTDRALDELRPDLQQTFVKLARMYVPAIMNDKIDAALKVLDDKQEVAPEGERPFLLEIRGQLLSLKSLYETYDSAAAALFAAVDGKASGASIAERRRALEQSEKRIDRTIKVLQVMLDKRIDYRVSLRGRAEGQDAWTIIGLSLVAIVLGMLAIAAAGRTLAPIRRLTEGVTRVGRGDYSAEVPQLARDEIGVLAREFNAMARALREREVQLAEQQAALVHAERLAAIGRVSAQITHEVRNPLSSIGLNAEMLEEALAEASFADPARRKEAKDLFAAIARELDRLTEITEQYLRLTRAPKPALRSEDVNELLGSLLDFLDEEHQRARVSVERRFAPSLPRVLADEGQLRQAFLNLLRNSREAMPQGGALVVASQPSGDGVELCVSDSGAGIAPEDLKRVFEPFFSTKERGTGLGLSMTRQIVAEHGGSIRCESELGRGTTFRVHLKGAPACTATSKTA